MAKKRISRKELREPDKFVHWTQVAASRIRPHLPRVAAGAVALAAVLVGASFYSRYRDGRDEKASAAFSLASNVEQADLLPAGAAPPQNPLDPNHTDAPQFKTAAEKYQAVLQKLDDLVSSYKRSPVARQAQLVEAGADFRLKQLDAAAKLYQGYIQSADSDDPGLSFAHEGLGFVYEAQGSYQDASGEFAKMASSDTAFGRDRSLYEQARMQELLGQKGAALAAYQQVAALPGTELRQAAENRVAFLQAQ